MPRSGSKVTRRRFLSIAATSAVGLVSRPAAAASVAWRGVALGAEAQIKLVHVDKEFARHIIKRCAIEIDRLENIFSLYRPASTLVRLNRAGAVRDPEIEFVELLSTAVQISRETAGAFDISVQSLWQLYADHFSEPDADPAGPSAALIRQALSRVGYTGVQVSPTTVVLDQAGMALTLNGIAQGFVTDRIRQLLQRNGFSNVLVHIGETHGSGLKSDGTPWLAGIADPDQPDRLIKRVALQDMSLATSSGAGYRFGRSNKHHLFDPRTGECSQRYRSISVAAPSATLADAFSTAFANMSVAAIKQVVAKRRDLRAIIVDPSGNVTDYA
ncbi:MAG: FAD:protein FMN transferase [Hyphomicrobiaceae bacterium]